MPSWMLSYQTVPETCVPPASVSVTLSVTGGALPQDGRYAEVAVVTTCAFCPTGAPGISMAINKLMLPPLIISH
jgi:hypothetical protein